MGAGASSSEQQSVTIDQSPTRQTSLRMPRHEEKEPEVDHGRDKKLEGKWFSRLHDSGIAASWDPIGNEVNERLETAFRAGKADVQVVIQGKLQTADFVSNTIKGYGGTKDIKREVSADKTPSKRREFDPFAEDEDDRAALFASPSASMVVESEKENSERAVLHSTIKVHTKPVYGVGFSVDGSCIITGCKDGHCKYWEANTSYLKTDFELHSGSVLCSVLSKSSPLAATGSDDDNARLFNVNKPEALFVLKGHTHKVYSVNFLDGHTLLSGSMDNSVRVWDTNTGQCKYVNEDHESSVFYTAVSQRNKNFALSASDDCSLHSHDFRKKNSVVARFTGHSRTLWGCDTRFDDGQFVSCGMDAKICLWDPRNESAPLKTFTNHRAAIHSVEYSPDGTALFTGARDHCFKMVECQEGKTIMSIYAHDGNVFRATYNAQSNMVMTTGTDCLVKLWTLNL